MKTNKTNNHYFVEDFIMTLEEMERRWNKEDEHTKL